MAACTFFGHRACPTDILDEIEAKIEDLVGNYGVDMFYVGNQGLFDSLVRSALRKKQLKYPCMRYAVVLAYPPVGRLEGSMDFSDTMLPEGIERVHPKYAIPWRNRWMIDHSEYVVAYVTHHWGGAAQFTELAARKGKTVVRLKTGDS